jgi:hypothetical protein
LPAAILHRRIFAGNFLNWPDHYLSNRLAERNLNMGKALSRVIDAIDIETFLYCKNEDEAKVLAESLAAELNLPHGDVVFLEQRGLGARVRIRSYIHHPGDHYQWLEGDGGQQ